MGEIGGNKTAYLTPDGSSEALDRLLFVETLDLQQTAGKTRGRSPRLWRDRTAIAVRSSSDRDSMAESPPRSSESIHWRIEITINPRSWPDRGAIVAPIEAESRPIHGQSGSHDVAPTSRSHDPCKSLPQLPQLPMIFGLIFPLKSHVFSLCSLTFDQFVKKLSKFRERSLVHHDPPVFRLDCEAIGAGLITNFFFISSNFPLEFQTSTRKNPSKFASIHEN